MIANDPFYPKYEMKPEWLRSKLHLPHSPETERRAREMVHEIAEEAKCGNFRTIVVAPSMIKQGLTHQLRNELMPAFEAEGGVCAYAERFVKPTNRALSRYIDVPSMTTAVARPAELQEVPDEQLKWMSEGRRKLHEKLRYRKNAGVEALPMPPYTPKIFSPSTGRNHILTEEERFEEIEREMENDHRFGRSHFGGRRDRNENTGNYRALCKLAAQNGRILCLFAEMSCVGKHVSKNIVRSWAEEFWRRHQQHMTASGLSPGGNTGVLVIGLNDPSPGAVKELKHFIQLDVLKFRPGSEEWTYDVLAAHQKESGREWLAEDALRMVARRYSGLPALAMLTCRMICNEGLRGVEKLDDVAPIGVEQVKKMNCWKRERRRR